MQIFYETVPGEEPQFPALVALGITARERIDLARQGFIGQERRDEKTYYKLRFRSGGRQVVRYLGNAETAARVRKELSILQRDSKMLRELKARTKAANHALRQAKRLLEPVLDSHGFTFHGFAIRRPRTIRR